MIVRVSVPASKLIEAGANGTHRFRRDLLGSRTHFHYSVAINLTVLIDVILVILGRYLRRRPL